MAADPHTEATSIPPQSEATPSRGRDVGVSTLVQMMGVATSSQLAAMEAKIDLLSAKLNTMQQRLERLSSMLDLASELDRIDVGLTEVRTLLKRVAIGAGMTVTSGSENQSAGVSERK